MSAQPSIGRRLVTETKHAVKTTEFWVFVILVIAILIATDVIGGGDTTADWFRADKGWLYVTILGAAYLISRGLAKSGSHDPYTDRPDGGGQGSITDRVKTAATVLTEGSPGGSHEDDATRQHGAYSQQQQPRQ